MSASHTETIAAAAHMANRAICLANGDTSQPLWSEAPEWQRSSAINGVQRALAGATPEQLHEGWSAEKIAAGWKVGPVKDAAAKTHPCLVAYAELPEFQRLKDKVFSDTVRDMAVLLVQSRVAVEMVPGHEPVIMVGVAALQIQDIVRAAQLLRAAPPTNHY